MLWFNVPPDTVYVTEDVDLLFTYIRVLLILKIPVHDHVHPQQEFNIIQPCAQPTEIARLTHSVSCLLDKSKYVKIL